MLSRQCSRRLQIRLWPNQAKFSVARYDHFALEQSKIGKINRRISTAIASVLPIFAQHFGTHSSNKRHWFVVCYPTLMAAALLVFKWRSYDLMAEW